MRKQFSIILGLSAAFLMVGMSTVALASDCNVLNCREQGGARWHIGGSLDIESGGDIDIESGAAFRIDGTDIVTELGTLSGVTASTADLNATTNFEETISATTSEVSIATGKTLDITDVGGLEIATVSVTADAAELNLMDGVTATTTKLNYVDVATAGTAEATKAVTTDANLDIAAIRNLSTTGDTTTSDPTNGGNAGERNTVIGNFNITIKSLGSMTNGSTETIALIDDTPANECAGVNQTTANDNTVVRVGTNSLKITFATTPSADDGADCTLTGADDFESNESIGFWFRTDTALNAGDMYAELDDDGGTDVQFDLPAVGTVDQWSWIELDITTCATCDVVDAIKFLVDSGGATTLVAGGNIWIDFAFKWAVADEEALGVDIVQDGVLGVITGPTAAGTGNTTSDLVENTDFFVNYQSGDVLVTMTDQSANYGIAFVAKQ